jgi:N-acyl-D-amino-acid deacylase
MSDGSDESSLTHYDVLIKGGMVYSGKYDKPSKQDIGIVGDHIQDVGDLHGSAEDVIDATGYIVTPGFIDIHNHSDLAFMMGDINSPIFQSSEMKGNYCYIHQGVTTIVTGNCGAGYANTDKWFDLLNSFKLGTNVYHLVPHGMIRMELCGADQPSELSAGQMEVFKSRIAEEMDKGAIGLSTGLEYAPGCVTLPKELVELAKVARRYGGIYTSHMRDESGKVNAVGEAGVISSIKETINLADEAEIPVQISHLKILPPYGTANAAKLIELIESGRQKGLDITADQYPYEANSTFINFILPADVKSPTGVKPEYKTLEGRGNLKQMINEIFTYLPPEKWVICQGEYAGQNLKQIGIAEHRKPEDVYVDMVTQEMAPWGLFFTQSMEYIKQIAQQEYVFTGSDGWIHSTSDPFKVHPRYFGTFIKKIRQFALDEKIMDLAAVIRSMTSLPASKIGAAKRGIIAVGNYADIAVIDLSKVEAPANYETPHLFSRGVEYLLVNGVIEIKNGKPTDRRGGKALKKGA